MASLVTNLNNLTVIGSTAQELVNWVTTADGCVQIANMTRLEPIAAAISRRKPP